MTRLATRGIGFHPGRMAEITLRQPSRSWQLGKVALEQYRLRRWTRQTTRIDNR